jgi:hypothetical protein
VKNQRERLFAIIVGAVAIVVVGFFVYGWIYGRFDTRTKEIARLKDEIKKFDRQSALGRAAARKIADYEQRSLPANPESARTGYQTWLVHEMETAGLIEPDVRLGNSQGSDKDLFIRHPFQVEASGTLPDVVEFLHAFYSVDWLHRITQLKLHPVKDSKLLDISLHIDTLSLRKASSVDKLEPRPSNRLSLPDRDAYYDTVVARNFFGPRNVEPKISISGSLESFFPREVELTIKGTDPDPYDQVYYKLVESSAPDAKLDPITGKFTWTPKAVGTYEFVVEGVDDGFPAKFSNREKFVLNVKEQKITAQTPTFDFAKFTDLTAVLDVDGQGEVWLHVRPLGRIEVLHQGDQFEIGTVKGTVSQIGDYDFCFDFEGKRRKLAKGELLDQAKVIGEVPQVAVPAKSPAVEVEVQAKPADKAT